MKNIIIASRFDKDIESWKSFIASDKKYAKLVEQIEFCVGGYSHLKSKFKPQDIRVIIAGIFLGDSYQNNFGSNLHEFTGYQSGPIPILFSSMLKPDCTQNYGASGMYLVAKNDENMQRLCDMLVEFDLEKVKDLQMFEERMKNLYKQEYNVG